jgi:hypothetical protein
MREELEKTVPPETEDRHSPEPVPYVILYPILVGPIRVTGKRAAI